MFSLLFNLIRSHFECIASCGGSWEKSTAAGQDKQCPGQQDPAGDTLKTNAHK